MQGTRCSRHILMKLEFSRQIFEKYSNIQFHENLPSRIFSMWTDKTVLTKRIVALRSFASALKIVVMEGIQLRFHKLA